MKAPRALTSRAKAKQASRATSVGDDVDRYVAAANAAQRPALTELRAQIRKRLPQASESLAANGFPVYTIDGAWVAGFAARSKGVMFYCMDAEAVAAQAAKLGKLITGKSCIAVRATDELDLEAVRAIVDSILVRAARNARRRAH